ncbi:phosphogluconate dehydratase [Silvimonas sp. JCM 19000]
MPAVSPVHPRLTEVTRRIVERSRESRQRYLARLDQAASKEPVRKGLACTNQAHGWAAAPEKDKIMLREMRHPNVAIVSSYNDMLSAHQPFETYPAIIKNAVHEVGATAQFAGGTPAMCDGVTQGEPGMELSLFSRDVIAMSTAIALSHNMFDAVTLLGVCDKIVPGLLIGVLQFGHLPAVFVPAGPMTSGISNGEKSKIRQLFAEGKCDRLELLRSEEASYHGAGTCTFYGTANSNQMLMEIMGLHLPGSAFVHPNTPLRDALTAEAGRVASRNTALGNNFIPVGRMIDEKAIVNGIVGLLATGGSTNHTMHLTAAARAAGIIIDWSDFDDLSAVVPLLAKIYPNGASDVNQFHAAGGMGYLTRELLKGGYLHADVTTVMGEGLHHYTREPFLIDGKVEWREAPEHSADESVLRPITKPFSADGGLRLLDGNLGRAVMKVSAVQPEHRIVEAPVMVFHDQHDVLEAFKRGEMEKDLIVVLRFQGPRAMGMPELHKLTPVMGVLQDRGFKVALITDGRMSGASGKVPSAIHITPEALAGGPLAKLRDGDIVRLDAVTGVLQAKVDSQVWASRERAEADLDANQHGMGRELFASFRHAATGAEEGALSLGLAH